MRTLAGAAALILGGYYMFGGAGSYSRVVDRPIAEVMASLEDLDIREQPGSPGTDPSRSGGVLPVFTHARTPDGMAWTVMSGKDVAVTMTAHLVAIDGGKRTKVTASVARGNASDDFVSPAFRSTGLTSALFAMALDAELDELTAPPPGNPAKCAALFERFQEGNLALPDLHERSGLKDAIGDVATATTRIAAFQQEARRMGCAPPSGGEFREVSNRMGAADPAPAPGVTIAPGAPMIDPNPPSR
jgi:hypothetical protein